MSAMPRRRNLIDERSILHNVARRALATFDAVERLIAHAEHRSLNLHGEYVTDPMLIAPARDRALDVREELADAVNHGRWWLQENPDHPHAGRRRLALGLIARAYQLWEDR
jgi:hypothetical protein